MNDKDAHDVYRLLVACSTHDLADAFRRLLSHDLAGSVTGLAVGFLRELFADSSRALGSVMAGRAETGIGMPNVVAASATALAADLLDALDD